MREEYTKSIFSTLKILILSTCTWSKMININQLLSNLRFSTGFKFNSCVVIKIELVEIQDKIHYKPLALIFPFFVHVAV